MLLFLQESGCGVVLSAEGFPDRPLYRGQLPFDDPLTIPSEGLCSSQQIRGADTTSSQGHCPVKPAAFCIHFIGVLDSLIYLIIYIFHEAEKLLKKI